jgi:hypothetical protein
MDDRGFFLTWQTISKQLAVMPSEKYSVRLIHAQSRCAFPGRTAVERRASGECRYHPVSARPQSARDAIFISTPTLGTKTQATFSSTSTFRSQWFWRPCAPMGMLPVWFCRPAPATCRLGSVAAPVRWNQQWRPLRASGWRMPTAAIRRARTGAIWEDSPVSLIRSPRGALLADKLPGSDWVRPFGPGGTSRLPVAVGPGFRAPTAAGAPCRRPCSLFDQRPGSRSKHRCRAGQRYLPWLYAALEDRRPLSATRLEHRRSLGRPSSVVAGNAGVPRRDHSPARQPAFPPPSPSSGRLPAPHPRAGCFSRPRVRAV